MLAALAPGRALKGHLFHVSNHRTAHSSWLDFCNPFPEIMNTWRITRRMPSMLHGTVLVGSLVFACLGLSPPEKTGSAESSQLFSMFFSTCHQPLSGQIEAEIRTPSPWPTCHESYCGQETSSGSLHCKLASYSKSFAMSSCGLFLYSKPRWCEIIFKATCTGWTWAPGDVHESCNNSVSVCSQPWLVLQFLQLLQSYAGIILFPEPVYNNSNNSLHCQQAFAFDT